MDAIESLQGQTNAENAYSRARLEIVIPSMTLPSRDRQGAVPAKFFLQF
jgi:hypothetical protein